MKNKYVKRGIFTGILVLMMILAGCSTSDDGNSGNENGSGDESGFPMTITDTMGNEVTLDEAPQKIVSVSPTLTETLFAIGAGDKMIGRTEYCNYPEEVKDLPVIGGFSDPNTELIIDLEPDLVFSSGMVPEEAMALLDSSGIKVLVIDGKTVDQIEENITLLGKVLDVEDKAAEVIQDIEATRTEVKEALGDAEPKKVFVDLGYYYSAGSGSFIHSIIVDELGAINIAADGEGEWPQISEELIVEKDPEVFIRNVNMGGGSEDEQISDSLKNITAVVEGNVVEIERGTVNNDIMTRAGARVGETIRLFAEAIYPEIFN
ncbi:ABC transporter substrate-binding protein [Alkalibacter mobilis]|uniref:ABC transporter substrate-binding protein n=1 Tax=Alkalibacter mobilis TaxID=2787712 RepID=UPI00189EACD8|nr:ABC transporter substrate-binding protein [Alkalibacter mobilis]MBF7096878.1 ABC transporter substrate-binding protein [Alkalibacter mobilis]